MSELTVATVRAKQDRAEHLTAEELLVLYFHECTGRARTGFSYPDDLERLQSAKYVSARGGRYWLTVVGADMLATILGDDAKRRNAP